MSLVTRCSNCATVFRVVQDQLKVSEGWVRCGRCNEVFNALEGLFDLGRDAPPAPSRTDDTASANAASPAPAGLDASARGGAADGSGDDAGAIGATLSFAPPLDPPPFASDAASADDNPPRLEPVAGPRFGKRRAEKAAAKDVDRDQPDFSDARFDSDLFADNLSPAETEQAELQATGVGDLPLENTRTPDFLLRAERRAKWRRRPLRSALVVAAVLATTTLLLQASHHFRDPLAARWPAARPAVVGWCEMIGCVVEPPRRIDDVSVESTALTQAVGRDALVLSVNVRSKSSTAVALPSVDLSLTDGNGRLVARRALSPRDFRAAPILPAGGDAALQLTLSTGGARVAGYTVELFYP